jgi:hypothetical protein
VTDTYTGTILGGLASAASRLGEKGGGTSVLESKTLAYDRRRESD